MKIELPQRIENKSFLSEIYEITARQLFPLKNPDQKSIFGGTLQQFYIYLFFPYFLMGFIFIAIYILFLRLVKRRTNMNYTLPEEKIYPEVSLEKKKYKLKVGKKILILGLLVSIIGILYLIFPKYYFITENNVLKYRCNKITGSCEARNPGEAWRPLPRTPTPTPTEPPKSIYEQFQQEKEILSVKPE